MSTITITKKHLSELLTDYYIKSKLSKAEKSVQLKQNALPINTEPQDTPKQPVFRVTEN